MSILCATPEGYIVSHEIFLRKTYRNVHEGDRVFPLCFHADIFKIDSPFMSDDKPKKKKRKLSISEELSSSSVLDVNVVKSCFNDLLQHARNKGFLCKNNIIQNVNENRQAKEMADNFYQQSAKWEKSFFIGSNNLDFPIIREVNDENYVFPEKCIFYCHNVESIGEKLKTENVKYNFILLDPPWWNKYIRRKKSKCLEGSYPMMYNEELKDIPISSLLAEDSLVGVWCTNSQQNINFLLDVVFPVWGLKYVGKWIWVKVTCCGEPVCAFAAPPRKQPYERIIFGCNSHHTSSRPYPLPEDGKLIVSVPSAIHSHKPPLSEVLSSYLPPEPKCLELFARYLLPKWTSWGNEVLKLQHTCLYQKPDL